MALILFWFLFASETKKHHYGPRLTALRYKDGQIRHPLGPHPHIVTVSSVSLFVSQTNSFGFDTLAQSSTRVSFLLERCNSSSARVWCKWLLTSANLCWVDWWGQRGVMTDQALKGRRLGPSPVCPCLTVKPGQVPACCLGLTFPVWTGCCLWSLAALGEHRTLLKGTWVRNWPRSLREFCGPHGVVPAEAGVGSGSREWKSKSTQKTEARKNA